MVCLSIDSEAAAELLLVWEGVFLVLIVSGSDEVGGQPLLYC